MIQLCWLNPSSYLLTVTLILPFSLLGDSSQPLLILHFQAYPTHSRSSRSPIALAFSLQSSFTQPLILTAHLYLWVSFFMVPIWTIFHSSLSPYCLLLFTPATEVSQVLFKAEEAWGCIYYSYCVLVSFKFVIYISTVISYSSHLFTVFLVMFHKYNTFLFSFNITSLVLPLCWYGNTRPLLVYLVHMGGIPLMKMWWSVQ